MAKIGEGSLGAMGRLGLHELRNATYPDSNIAHHGEVGMYGNPTQGEVAEARESEPEKESIVDRHVREAESHPEPNEPDRDPDRDR
ncbi:MAG: hypothetical protein JNK76_20790 [Planctomycetales bacterium]|nr:hypothetical protein [Planctomycetales bacterium]